MSKRRLLPMLRLISALLLLSAAADAATDPSDLAALRDLKSAIDPSTIRSSTCVASWDFSSADPCDSRSKSLFICGIACGTPDPQSGARRIVTLMLDGSGYRGTLPPSIASLSALQVLDISGNAFSGPLPDTLLAGGLLNLIKMDLSRNALSGSIPSRISEMRNLTYLSLANNNLQGGIPASITNLVSLERLFIHNNNLSGEIPSLDKLLQLNYFDASENLLTALPLELPPSLMQLSVRRNRLTGELPRNLADAQGLEVLDLSENEFSGHLDGSVFDLPALQQLTLAKNRISSVGVPKSGSGNTELIAVDMSYNLLAGVLPVFLADMKRLSALSLRYNNFSGTIPYEFASKARAESEGVQPLMRLFLDGNYLIGEVPQPFLEAPDRLSASFIYNCLKDCPASFAFCQGGGQRPKSECPVL